MTDSDDQRAIQMEVRECDRCIRDSDIGPQLRSLPFFLPLSSNVEEPSYTYLSVAMEPSGNWLRTEAEGRRRVSDGYADLVTTLNDKRCLI